MSLLLEGKRAFITGGTRGIGAALCEVFAREGADVAFNYGSRDDLAEETKKKIDRKSTRLNSSHGYISYAVFCLKKKKNETPTDTVLARPYQEPHVMAMMIAFSASS